MAIIRFTRRAFLALAILTGLSSSAVAARLHLHWPPGGGRVVFKRSGHGRRISQAAKAHNANRLYRTRAAALGDLPHRGDHSFVTWKVISDDQYKQLFGGGADIVDLRRDLPQAGQRKPGLSFGR